MKNLPEDDLFRAIEDRLRNYEEIPDEGDWDKIAASIPKREATWSRWSDGITLLLLLLLMANTVYEAQKFTRDTVATRPAVSDDIVQTIDPLTDNRATSKDTPTNKAGISQADANDVPKDAYHDVVDDVPSKSISVNGLNRNAGNVEREDNARRVGTANPGASPATSMDEKSDRETWRISGVDADNRLMNITNVLTSESKSTLDEMNQSDSLFSEGNHSEEAASLPAAQQVSAKTNDTESTEIAPQGSMEQKKSRFKRRALTLYSMLAPSLSYQHITPKSNDAIVLQNWDSPSVLSSERLGYSIELGIQKTIGLRFNLIAGISYYHQAVTLHYDQITESAVVDATGKFSYEIQPTIQTKSLNYSMNNVGVNSALLYTLSMHKLIHSVGIGFQYDIGLSGKRNGEVYENSTSRYFNGQVLYRVEYQVSGRLSVFVQPAYLQAITVNESNALPFDMKQGRASIGFGIRYSFRR